MPTCPACGGTVGYDELRSHLGSCRFVWSEAPRGTDRLTQHLAARIKRLEDRLHGGAGSRERGQGEPDDRTRAGASRQAAREPNERRELR